MKLPILVTMSWPERVACSEKTWPRLDFVKVPLIISCRFYHLLAEETRASLVHEHSIGSSPDQCHTFYCARYSPTRKDFVA